jgi:hypothetical protein
VVTGEHRQLARARPGREQLRRALELARLTGERDVTRDDQVVDRFLLQGLEDLLEQLERVPVAVPGRDAVARVPRPIADVEVGDVAEPQDEAPPRKMSRC